MCDEVKWYSGPPLADIFGRGRCDCNLSLYARPVTRRGAGGSPHCNIFRYHWKNVLDIV